MKTTVTNDSKETQQFAYEFAKELTGGDIVLLYGNLGAGKTTFTQGLAKGLGITHRIMSPTFIIMRSYKIEKSSIQNVYHIDLYRIATEHEIEDAGVVDVMGRPGTVTIIEWPEKMGSLLPKKRWELRFEYVDESQRKIMVEKID